ncbi:MAG: hypothetical protein NVS1B10_04380 [Candidatus Saccharimonadales bacterium]
MTTNTVIFGLSGSNGAGKDTVGNILATRYNYCFISVTDILRSHLKDLGQPGSRENSRELSAKWRRQSGLGVLVDKAVEVYQSSQTKYAGLVISSIRNSGEADSIHDLGGQMIWIDADPKIRYERIQANISTRGRLEDDNKSFEQFLAEEEIEMNRPLSGDAATLNMKDVKAKCDVFLDNSQPDLDVFQRQIVEKLKLKDN